VTHLAVIDGPNHGWDRCRVSFERAMRTDTDLSLSVGEKADLLKPEALRATDVVVLGSGFMHMVGKPGAPGTHWEPELSPEEVAALTQFVSSGGGLLGLHITGWFLEGELYKLLGGSSNLHPPIEETGRVLVQFVQPAHEIVEGLDDFVVENDEVYLVAWSPTTRVLATTGWAGRAVPVMWLSHYGRGRVFYCSLGHFPHSFEYPAMVEALTRAARWCAGPGSKKAGASRGD
jgi:type 1 glutamine amidotransferase